MALGLVLFATPIRRARSRIGLKMLLLDEPKRRRRPHQPRGYARGNVIVWLEVSPYVWRAYWCSALSFKPSDLDPVAMTLKNGGLTLSVAYLTDMRDEPTECWTKAVIAVAQHGDLLFRIDLRERLCIRLSDRFPVLH